MKILISCLLFLVGSLLLGYGVWAQISFTKLATLEHEMPSAVYHPYNTISAPIINYYFNHSKNPEDAVNTVVRVVRALQWSGLILLGLGILTGISAVLKMKGKSLSSFFRW